MINPQTVIGETLEISALVKDRTQLEVILSLSEEVGELATEMAIKVEHSSKSPGKDGIKGEAVDIILCALDILYLEGATEAEIIDLMRTKGSKWLANKRK
jgi:hypothetical protein